MAEDKSTDIVRRVKWRLVLPLAFFFLPASHEGEKSAAPAGRVPAAVVAPST